MNTLKAILLLSAIGTMNCAAFNFSYNSNSFPAHWNLINPDASVPTNSFNRNTHAIRYFIGSDGWSTTNTAAELNAVRSSFGQWQSIPGIAIKFEEGGLIPPVYKLNNTNNTNVVYWAKTNTINQNDITGALGFTSRLASSTDNTIRQFNIVLNGWQYNWFTDFNDKKNPNLFVECTLLHEIGHALGLSHSAIGGATMMYAEVGGVDANAGLSVDEIAFAKALYSSSNLLTTLGNVAGSVTKNGAPVNGAAVIAESATGLMAGGTVTLSNGTYVLNALPPGGYNLRVVPLDPSTASDWLIRGIDVATNFANADTTFLPTGNTPVTLVANTTNTANFAVVSGTPPFRITLIRFPTTNAGAYAIGGQPVSMSPGQSNYNVGVFSADLPTTNAAFTITGDGLTLGAREFKPGTVFAGLNGITMSIGVSSNATPGLRSFVVLQNGNVAYANGFFEVLPKVYDYNFDGLDDIFQRAYFAPFTSTNAAPGADPDGDGANNYSEYVAGTNPTDTNSALKLTSTTTTANGTTVRWQSVSGKSYQLMSRTNAVLGTWQNIGSIYTASNGNAQVLDNAATNGIHLYRVQALP